MHTTSSDPRVNSGLATCLLVAVLGVMPVGASSAARGEESPATSQPGAPARVVEFTTDEGTWMSVDISPDGNKIVFDLLGDIYVLPASGGPAQRLASGRAYDHQPRWSPDGKQIAFISDRSGSDNLWVMAADGSNPRQVSKDEDWGIYSPAWSPDGNYLAVSRRVEQGYELWLYHQQGGEGLRLTPSSEVSNPLGPVFSPDGQFIYFSSGVNRLGEPFSPWQLYRLERSTGQLFQVTNTFGGAVRPAVSPDGRFIAFIRRRDGRSGLWWRDMLTGREELLVANVSQDAQMLPRDVDLYPGFCFTPDGGTLLVSFGGKLQRVDLATKTASVVPFTAAVRQELAARPYHPWRITDEDVQVSVIRWPGMTPDGQTLVFEALGKVWTMKLPDGQPRRLTSQTAHREYSPAVSPDGRWVAYVSWDDDEGGHVWKAPLAGGTPERLTRLARQYANPAWSPDGQTLVVSWRPPNYGDTGNLPERDPYHELVALPAAGGETRLLATYRPTPSLPLRLFTTPVVVGNEPRVFFVDYSGKLEARDWAGRSLARPELVSLRLDGSDRRVHARFDQVDAAVPSPDGLWLAFTSGADLYLMPLPPAGGPVEVDTKKPAFPLRRLNADGGEYPNWAAGRVLSWANGRSFFYQPIEAQSPTEVAVNLRAPRYRPRGVVALRGARLITLRGDEVIPRGDIVVTDNRITALGPSGQVPIPKGAVVFNLAGKTIIPGFIDMHYHAHYNGNEIFRENKWQYAADLAYGVTTGRDPSGPTRDMFVQADMIEAGEMLGPRLVNTGLPFFPRRESMAGGNRVGSLEEARRVVRNRRLHGARYLKQHSMPRRDDRQWLQQAAGEQGLMITAEGYSLKIQLSMMLDGYTGVEHANPVAPLYKDVLEMYARSGIFYTPTILVGYGQPRGIDYFYQQGDWDQDEKAQRFMPDDMLDRYARRRWMMPDSEYYFLDIARAARDIVRAGGKVAMGGHGNHPGLGAHWEIWTFVLGGLSPHEALRQASVVGAEAIGLPNDLGTLEPGKLADLIVLNANPLDDIRNTLQIHQVMKNGELFDGQTLDKLWPEKKPLGKLF